MNKQKQKSKRWIYIYRIYFPTSKKCYIGQTVNLNGRLQVHLRKKFAIGNALRKYDNYKISVLHKTKSQKKANKLEIAAIAAHNSIAPGGYNLATGGSNGNNFAGKTEKEMLEFGKKISETNKGHQVSKETRKKLSKAGIIAQNRPEEIIKNTLSKMRLPYTNKTAIEALQNRLEYWKIHKQIVHGIDYQKIRIKNLQRCLKWLNEGGIIA